MSGEAAAASTEATAAATEAVTTEATAVTEQTTEVATVAEKPAFDPAKRNFKAEMAARIAAREQAVVKPVETQGTDQAEAEAEAEAEVKPAPKTEEKKPPKNTRDRLGNARKAFFQRIEAEKAAQLANNQAQTEAQKVEQLQSELEAARSFENQYKTLIREGKYDEAIKLSGELDGVEALQRRILERENLLPKNDPAVGEMKAELEALKKQVQDREKQEAEVREQARQQAEDKALLDLVTETSLNHEDEKIQKWGKFPGFNEQVLAAVKQFPQYTEDQIYGEIVKGFEGMREQLFQIFGAPAAQTSAPPARSSVKTEAASAVKPERKPLVSVPTNAAESSKPEPFDPMSKSERERFKEFIERRHGRR